MNQLFLERERLNFASACERKKAESDNWKKGAIGKEIFVMIEKLLR